jgi:hypothetical protein
MRQRDRAAGGRTDSKKLSGELLESYTRAVYRVDCPPSPLFLVVGQANPGLDRWLAAAGVSCFALVSAANPGSVALSAAANRLRHRALRQRLRASGLPLVAGESSEGESGGWREASLLVCGIERPAAIALARDFGQAALLVGEAGAAVELVFTATAPKSG